MRSLLIAAAILPAVAPAATLAGRIIEDHTGSPVPSASVQMTTGSLRGLAADLETDGQGRFEAPGLPEGEYRVEVTKPNYLKATIRLHLTTQGIDTKIRLIRCAVITGQVTDRDGLPFPSATVFAMAKPAEGKPLQRNFDSGHFARVDQRGNYRLYDLPPGQYLVALSYGASSATFGSSGGLPPPSLPGSGVMFYPDNSRPQVFELSAGEERHNLNFSVTPTALFSIRGAVTMPDPKEGFWVVLTPTDQPAIAVAVASFRKPGEFRLEGIPPGSYDLVAFGPDDGFGWRGAVFPKESDPMFARVHLDVGGQNIEGISLTPEAGKPIHFLLRLATGAGAFCPATAELALTQVEDFATMTDRTLGLKAEQDASVPFLVPEHYSMSLTGLGDNCVLISDPIFDAAQAPNPVVLTVGPAGAIRGKLDSAGQPPSNFTVVLIHADAPDTVLATVPDAQSQFAFTGLKPGKYRIAAQSAASGSRWMAGADQAANQAIEIEVHPGSSLQIDLATPVEARQ